MRELTPPWSRGPHPIGGAVSPAYQRSQTRMTNRNAETDGTDSLAVVLMAGARSREIPEAADAYGWLVGSWDLDVLHYWAMDVSVQRIKAQVHAAWVLEGRAVQDVWIMPPRPDRTASLDKKMNMYGTTLRVWDHTIQAWRITWRNPAG